MRFKFFLSVSLGGLWLILSCWLAVFWAEVVSSVFPGAYVWWVIIGIALLPGFMMSSMLRRHSFTVSQLCNLKEETSVPQLPYFQKSM